MAVTLARGTTPRGRVPRLSAATAAHAFRRGTDRWATREAAAIPRQIAAIREDLSELAGDRSLRRQGREALLEAFLDCLDPDWDGYGGLPADPLSASWAEYAVAPLLPILGLPHYSFDPHGDALMEWYRAPDRTLDLSVGDNGELRYAARIGGARVNGVEQFAEALPPGLMSVAQRLAR